MSESLRDRLLAEATAWERKHYGDRGLRERAEATVKLLREAAAALPAPPAYKVDKRRGTFELVYPGDREAASPSGEAATDRIAEEGAVAMRWGIYDTKDHLWLGDDAGPKVFDSEALAPNGEPFGRFAFFLARAAAEAASFCIREDNIHRFEPRELPAGPWRIKDQIEKTRGTLEWLRKKEGGVIP